MTKDVKTGDLVLKRNLPIIAPTDNPTHLLPRCSVGPYELLEMSSMDVRLKHTPIGKEVESSLRHIRPVYLREDSTMNEDGGLKFASNEYVIVNIPSCRSRSDPKWQVAKLLHPNLDEDAWVVQWCSTKGTTDTLELTRSSFSLGVREPTQKRKL